jgi:hypothetical protein
MVQITQMQKIPCTECGALILPATADATGGKCMACQQGIRASMEASRAYYQRLKEYDPYRELWVSLVERSSPDHDLTGWSEQEKRYFAAGLLEGEIHNGGFDQYFSNTSGRYYSIAVDALKEIEAFRSLEIVEKAAAILFGKRSPPESQEDRWRILYAKTRKFSAFLTRRRRAAELEQLDKQFWGDPDRLNDRLMAYAEEHDLVTPFLVGNR